MADSSHHVVLGNRYDVATIVATRGGDADVEVAVGYTGAGIPKIHLGMESHAVARLCVPGGKELIISADGSVDLATPELPPLPLPGHTFDNLQVVASIWIRDEDPPLTAMLLAIASERPYYRIVDITWSDGIWVTHVSKDFENIVPAVDYYRQQGGDY